MLLVLNLPLDPHVGEGAQNPYVYLFPMILLFCLIGAYSINNTAMDILIMNIFGLLGYVMKKVELRRGSLGPCPCPWTHVRK